MNMPTKNRQDNTTAKRNSYFELYRFLFALWVVWYHGYFIVKNQYFDDGYLAVEFFFLLSGFYFTKTLDKFTEATFMRGLVMMIKSKLKPLGITFLIGVIFVIWQAVLEGGPVLFGYLWYIPIMLLSFILIYVLRRLIKRNSLFISILIGMALCCYLILYIPISEKLGVARGIGVVSLGVLLSFIPKIELRVGKINFNLILTALIFGEVLYLAFLPKEGLMCEHLLIFLLMPMLIYFTSTLQLNNKVLNFLGSMSFPIYAYQCVLRVIRMIVSTPQYILFIILMCLVTADLLIKLAIRLSIKNRKAVA